MVPAYTGIPTGTASRNVIAIGTMSKFNSSCNSAANPFHSCSIFASPSRSIVDSPPSAPPNWVLRTATSCAQYLAFRRLLLSPDVPHGFVLGWEFGSVVHKGWYWIADAILMRTL